MDKVFITGASGLLGRRLVHCYSKNNFFVFAHYKSNIPKDLQNINNVEWLKGDFVNPKSVDTFFNKYKDYLLQCNVLINNYGPIIYKDWEELTKKDFLDMNFSNLIVPYKFLKEMLADKKLKSVVNIGFSSCGDCKPYKKILPYAMAKNSLYLLTLSLSEIFKDKFINMISPFTLQGAEVKSPNEKLISPEYVAEEIYNLSLMEVSGTHKILDEVNK